MTKNSILKNIKLVKLKRIKNSNGDLLRVLRKSENEYSKFGEAYFTFIKKNKTKGWKKHYKMKSNIVVPIGKVRFVFFDEKNDSFREETIGENNYFRLTIPPKVWFAFQGVYKSDSLILNMSNMIHDDKEEIKIPLKDINYSW